MLRRPPKGRSIWVRPNPVFVEPPTGQSMNVPRCRVGRWKPLGLRRHASSDPTLFKLSSFLGKSVLIEYVRRVVATDVAIARLIERWDALTAGARHFVTLSDLCQAVQITTAQFVLAAARGCREAGDCCVLLGLQRMELPEDVEAVVREFLETAAD